MGFYKRWYRKGKFRLQSKQSGLRSTRRVPRVEWSSGRGVNNSAFSVYYRTISTTRPHTRAFAHGDNMSALRR